MLFLCLLYNNIIVRKCCVPKSSQWIIALFFLSLTRLNNTFITTHWSFFSFHFIVTFVFSRRWLLLNPMMKQGMYGLLNAKHQFLFISLSCTLLAQASDDQRLDSAIQQTKLITNQKFGFIKRVDKGWITTVKDLESWCSEC